MDCGIDNADNSDVPRRLRIVFNRPLYDITHMDSDFRHCHAWLNVWGINQDTEDEEVFRRVDEYK